MSEDSFWFSGSNCSKNGSKLRNPSCVSSAQWMYWWSCLHSVPGGRPRCFGHQLWRPFCCSCWEYLVEKLKVFWRKPLLKPFPGWLIVSAKLSHKGCKLASTMSSWKRNRAPLVRNYALQFRGLCESLEAWQMRCLLHLHLLPAFAFLCLAHLCWMLHRLLPVPENFLREFDDAAPAADIQSVAESAETIGSSQPDSQPEPARVQAILWQCQPLHGQTFSLRKHPEEQHASRWQWLCSSYLSWLRGKNQHWSAQFLAECFPKSEPVKKRPAAIKIRSPGLKRPAAEPDVPAANSSGSVCNFAIMYYKEPKHSWAIRQKDTGKQLFPSGLQG